MVWALIEKRRRIRRQESDGGGDAREKTERKTEAEVAGQETSTPHKSRKRCGRRN